MKIDFSTNETVVQSAMNDYFASSAGMKRIKEYCISKNFTFLFIIKIIPYIDENLVEVKICINTPTRDRVKDCITFIYDLEIETSLSFRQIIRGLNNE